MLSTFFESLGGKLADRIAGAVGASLCFWLAGLAAWALHRGGFRGFDGQVRLLADRPESLQLADAALFLLLVVASSLLVARLTQPALRLIEGYWPAFLARPRDRLSDRVARRDASDETRERELAALMADPGVLSDREEYARLTQRRRRRPGRQHGFQPTRVGNVLRAAETRPTDKYGLDVVAVWPHLWLVFPETTRQELLAARQALDASVGGFLWTLALAVFTPLTWWALPVALVLAAIVYLVWVPVRAENFADLVEASVDLYRTLLYRQLRWPLPADPDGERVAGRKMTTYLVRGLAPGLLFDGSREGQREDAPEHEQAGGNAPQDAGLARGTPDPAGSPAATPK